MSFRTLTITVSPQARASYLALFSIARRFFSASSTQKSQYNRSDFTGQGFTSFYEPDQPTRGPLGGASNVGASQITPRVLRQHLDQFVVGQERAKVVLSVAIHEHYLRIRELERQREQQARLEAQAQRKAMAYRHPVEDEWPGQQPTMEVHPPQASPHLDGSSSMLLDAPLPEADTLEIEKSNVLIMGPTGVGKTLMCKTLAKVLGVPISMSDCTTFTQAGYIGEDVESCVHRLFATSGQDVEATERGIIVLDEVDKIASAKMAHGRDVGGEGVQQALLKVIEGTTVQIKTEKANKNPGSISGNLQGANKGEVYNVQTENILFICTGAFPNLHKHILDRKSKGGMGFGASIRTTNLEPGSQEIMLTGEDAATFKQDSPFFMPPKQEVPNPFGVREGPKEEPVNVLDHTLPSDLQRYGMIPELVGRIPTMCAVGALDEEALVRVLTEPKNSLIRQEECKFHSTGIEIRFTNGALQEIAKKAVEMGTGARGLKKVMDNLLLQTKFETPGSAVKHILVTQDAAQLKCAPLRFHRGQSHSFQATLAQEEDKWEEQLRSKEDSSVGHVSTFEEYRKAGAAGF